MVASEYDKTNHISVQGVGGWWWCGGECGVVMKMGGIRNGTQQDLKKMIDWSNLGAKWGPTKLQRILPPTPPSPEISFLQILLFHNPICTQPWGQISGSRVNHQR